MAAPEYNLKVARGEDFSFELVIRDASDAVVTLSGDTFAGEVRRRHNAPKIATFTFDVTQLSGLVELKLPKAETLKLDPSRTYEYDVFWTDSSASATIHLIRGQVDVIPNITHITAS